jgi:uncharacterized protein (UPF0218 family)
MKALRLPDRLRPVLQRPLGRLLEGGLEEVYGRVKAMVEELKPPRLVAVGDVVARDAIKQGLKLDLAIGDFKTKRAEVEGLPKDAFREVVRVCNPQGFITLEACRKVASCLRGEGGVLMEVEGEEDLLAIPCMLHAPSGSLIIYGQPGEGVVAVVVSEGLKAFLRSLLEAFEEVRIK